MRVCNNNEDNLIDFDYINPGEVFRFVEGIYKGLLCLRATEGRLFCILKDGRIRTHTAVLGEKVERVEGCFQIEE